MTEPSYDPWETIDARIDSAKEKASISIFKPVEVDESASTPSASFARLAAHGLLHEEKEINDTLHASGIRYQQDDFYGRATKQQERAIGARFLPVVRAIVVGGKSLTVAGQKYTNHKAPTAAAAVAGERLQIGLLGLAEYYGHIRHGRLVV